MPSRIVRDGIISSPRVNSLSLGAEVFYRRLMSVVDDFGRYYGSIPTLRGACWPTNPERFREKDVSKWLNELLKGESPLVRTYNVAGAVYLEIQDFHQRTRSESKFPCPPWQTNDGQVTVKTPSNDGECADNCPPNDGSSRISKTKTKTNSGGGQTAARKRNRSTEEIRAALGPRISWWEQFWAEYPCHEDMNRGMDAFERVVTTLELFAKVLAGAKSYREKSRRNPDMKLKYAQGWINAERWQDEYAEARDSPASGGAFRPQEPRLMF